MAGKLGGVWSSLRRPVIALTALSLVVLAGCGGPGSSASGPTVVAAAPAAVDGASTPVATTSAPAAAAPAPATTIEVPASLRFTATLIDGTPFDAATYVGRTVAFWFWAPT